MREQALNSFAQLAGVAPAKYWQTLPNLDNQSFVFLCFYQRETWVPWVFVLLFKLRQLLDLRQEVLQVKDKVALLQVPVHDLDQIGS